MRITYVKHSCFTVELENSVLIFDYYKGDLIKFMVEKNIYVFISHKHHDHFNPKIFELSLLYENITFILPSYMKMSERYMDQININIQARNKIQYIGKNTESTFNSVNIKTLKSTDEGVAFIVKIDGYTIYHAGDLNWWSWIGETVEEYLDMEKEFKNEIKKIENEHFDVAFLPLDPRQEDRFWWGFDFFMKSTDTTIAFPMHFWNYYKLIKDFKEMDCTNNYKDKIIVITKKEESFEI